MKGISVMCVKRNSIEFFDRKGEFSVNNYNVIGKKLVDLEELRKSVL